MKQIFRILAPLTLVILFAVELSSCGQETTGATTPTEPPAPLNEVDKRINDYEKLTTEYARVARRFNGGDLSVTVRYIDQSKSTREEAVKLQQMSGEMTLQQAQRLADISTKVAPYLSK